MTSDKAGTQTDRWRIADLALEAVKNVLCSRSTLIKVACLAAILGLALTFFRTQELVQLDAKVAELEANGRNTVVIQGTDPKKPSRINRHSCDALSGTAGVLASGALVQQGVVKAQAPQLGTNFFHYGASPSLVGELSQSTVGVGQARLELPAKSKLFLRYESNSVDAAILERRGNGIPINDSIVSALRPDVIATETCVVVLDQKLDAKVLLPSLASQLSVESGALVAAFTLPETFNPFEEFRTRLTRLVPLVVGIALGGLIGLVTLMRSSEFATYRLSGTSRASLLKILFFEASTVSGIFWLASSATLLFWNIEADLTTGLIAEQLSVSCISILTAMFFATFCVRRPATEMAKDR